MAHFSFKTKSSSKGFNMKCNIRQAAYNNDPMLIQALRAGDLEKLQGLFAVGKANANDLLAPWGNTLLHEAVFGFTSETPNSFQICELLLNEGVDPNVRSSSGQTPLLLCSRLMRETFRVELQDLASLLVRYKADLAIIDPNGNSVCSEIFQAQHGVRYFESFLYKHVDLFALEQMASTDAWIIGSLARSFPTFELCLQGHIQEYRTPPSISSCVLPRSNYIKELDIEQQVREVKQAKPSARTGFLKALCASGTLKMVMPFLKAGVDLNETDSSAVSYARAAAKAGNIEVLRALSQAGASLEPRMTSFVASTWGPIEELLERWFSLRIGRPVYYGSPTDEYHILQELLQGSDFRGPDTILLALQTRQPPFVFKTLLDAGLGRRRNQFVSWELKRMGSEIILAVIENNKNLRHFLDYRLELECEDKFGLTALLHAIDGGRSRLHMIDMLIDAGADLFRRTRSGYTPLEFAVKNLKAQHPRSLERWSYASRSFVTVIIQEEEDAMTYAHLKRAVRQKRLTGIQQRIRVEFTLEQILAFRLIDIVPQLQFQLRTILWLLLGTVGLGMSLKCFATFRNGMTCRIFESRDAE